MRNFWCEIDARLLDDNISKIRQNSDKRIMAVIKCNAYGVGIEEFTAYVDDKVDCYGAGTVEEALRAKTNKDILLMYPVLSKEDIGKLKDNFVVTVDNRELLDELKASGKKQRVHIYVDTGMNRFGVKPYELKDFYEMIVKEYPQTEVEGIFTHLHNVKDTAYTQNQIKMFEECVYELKDKVKYIHILNSRGFLSYSQYSTLDNTIRLGNLLYGYEGKEYGYHKIFDFKAVPIKTYTVEEGQYVGYGCHYKTKRPTRIGIFDFGIVDNFYFSRRMKMNILRDVAKTAYYHFKYYSGIFCNGKAMHIIGEPSMVFTLVDLGDVGENEIFTVDMTTLSADTSIPKIWKRGRENV